MLPKKSSLLMHTSGINAFTSIACSCKEEFETAQPAAATTHHGEALDVLLSVDRDHSEVEGTDFRSTLSNKIEPRRDQDRILVVEPSPS